MQRPLRSLEFMIWIMCEVIWPWCCSCVKGSPTSGRPREEDDRRAAELVSASHWGRRKTFIITDNWKQKKADIIIYLMRIFLPTSKLGNNKHGTVIKKKKISPLLLNTKKYFPIVNFSTVIRITENLRTDSCLHNGFFQNENTTCFV